jgi:UDP-N-acetylglucosamine--dolichyl-phosphate N-acetylglucosaminephosphotransferase
MKFWLALEVLVLLLFSAIMAMLGFLSGFWSSLLLVMGVALVATYNILPFVIYRMRLQKIVGKDMNKPHTPLVPEMGGIATAFGFSLAVLLAIFVYSFGKSIIRLDMNLTVLFAGFSTILLMAFLGIFDDLIGWKRGIRKYQHALIPLFAALPLMAIRVGTTHLSIPVIGTIDFGIFYALLLIPIGVTGAANAVNMLAGLNGLEAGLGIILTGTMLLLSALSGQTEAAIIMAAMFGALIAFLKFNWFPAKIFPGDATTLMVGASIAVASIVGNMEKIGVMLLFLLFIELILKARYKFQTESFGVPRKDGTLQAPAKTSSLTHWVMKQGRFNEKQVVFIILSMQVIVSMIVIAYWYLNSQQFFNQFFVG